MQEVREDLDSKFLSQTSLNTPLVSNISSTRKSVSSDFQTPTNELKKKKNRYNRVFLNHLRLKHCFEC